MKEWHHGPLDCWHELLEKDLRTASRGGWLSMETWIKSIQAESDDVEELAEALWNVNNLQAYVQGPQEVFVLAQQIYAARATLLAWLAVAHSVYSRLL